MSYHGDGVRKKGHNLEQARGTPQRDGPVVTAVLFLDSLRGGLKNAKLLRQKPQRAKVLRIPPVDILQDCPSPGPLWGGQCARFGPCKQSFSLRKGGWPSWLLVLTPFILVSRRTVSKDPWNDREVNLDFYSHAFCPTALLLTMKHAHACVKYSDLLPLVILLHGVLCMNICKDGKSSAC